MRLSWKNIVRFLALFSAVTETAFAQRPAGVLVTSDGATSSTGTIYAGIEGINGTPIIGNPSFNLTAAVEQRIISPDETARENLLTAMRYLNKNMPPIIIESLQAALKIPDLKFFLISSADYKKIIANPGQAAGYAPATRCIILKAEEPWQKFLHQIIHELWHALAHAGQLQNKTSFDALSARCWNTITKKNHVKKIIDQFLEKIRAIKAILVKEDSDKSLSQIEKNQLIHYRSLFPENYYTLFAGLMIDVYTDPSSGADSFTDTMVDPLHATIDFYNYALKALKEESQARPDTQLYEAFTYTSLFPPTFLEEIAPGLLEHLELMIRRVANPISPAEGLNYTNLNTLLDSEMIVSIHNPEAIIRGDGHRPSVINYIRNKLHQGPTPNKKTLDRFKNFLNAIIADDHKNKRTDGFTRDTSNLALLGDIEFAAGNYHAAYEHYITVFSKAQDAKMKVDPYITERSLECLLQARTPEAYAAGKAFATSLLNAPNIKAVMGKKIEEFIAKFSTQTQPSLNVRPTKQ